jgi:Rrf2 family transcriptional regulator, iron-sulfur cluster assembly transcription factor
MIAKTTLHAIKALAALADNQPGDYAGAGAVAERIQAPPNYLAKLLQSLARVGIVQGQKGLYGGFRLARKPDKISLFEVADQIEQVSRWNGCFLGQGSGACRADRPCAVHDRWARVREAYVDFLKQTSVLDIVKKKAAP